MKKSTFFDAFYKNAGYLAVILISLIYIGGSFILISKTGKSVYEIIASGVLSMITGLLINGIFRSLGIRQAESDPRTVSTEKLYSDSVEAIVPHIDRLGDFCENENKRALYSIRTKVLARAGLRYSDFFDENGILYSHDYELYSCEEIRGATKSRARKMKGINRKRRNAYKRALNTKIKLLTPSALTSEGAKENDPFDFGKSKKEYSTQRNLSDMISRILMAIIFGYFGVSFVSEVNPALLIWNTMQIIMYITSGIIQMYSSFAYIVDEHRQSVIKRIDYLQKFKIYAENAPKPNISS
jgi:hypothetical protein